MSDVISLNERKTQKLDTFDTNRDIYFPVAMRNIDVPGLSDANTDNFRAVVRTDTNEVLSVQSPKYKLLRNEDVYPVFENYLKHSMIDTTDMYIQDSIAYNGARTIRSYKFPAHQVVIKKGDLVDMELRVTNSYDGSYPFMALVGGWRLICSNGMVIGETYSKVYGRHTLNLNISDAAIRTNLALQAFLVESEKWKHWANSRITDEEAERIFKAMNGAGERVSKELMLIYQDEKSELGNTLWAVYNALTYWSTHKEVREGSAGNVAAITLERENRVRSALRSPTFLNLARAA